MSQGNTRRPESGESHRRAHTSTRKHYEPPRLVDYGRIAKLTQSGGITTKDSGNMERRGP